MVPLGHFEEKNNLPSSHDGEKCFGRKAMMEMLSTDIGILAAEQWLIILKLKTTSRCVCVLEMNAADVL